jgi:hypothetical protein
VLMMNLLDSCRPSSMLAVWFTMHKAQDRKAYEAQQMKHHIM